MRIAHFDWSPCCAREPCTSNKRTGKYVLRDVKPVDTIAQSTRFVKPHWLVDFEAVAIIATR